MDDDAFAEHVIVIEGTGLADFEGALDVVVELFQFDILDVVTQQGLIELGEVGVVEFRAGEGLVDFFRPDGFSVRGIARGIARELRGTTEKIARLRRFL